MTIFTGLMFVLALTTLRLSAAANTSVVTHLGVATAMVAPLLAGRWFSIRRSVPAAVVLIGAAAWFGLIVSTMSLAAEEFVLAALLGLAAGVYVNGRDSASLGRTAILSVIVVLFSLPGVEERYRLGVIVAAVSCGSLWLIASTTAAGSASSARDRWAWIYGGAIVTALAGVCVVSHAVIRPTDGNPWYAAWAPTSGGDQAGDENARRGTGDGPDEISSDAPDSIGFDKSDTFSESGRDGLYDLWVESYGAPVKPTEQQKMIGLKNKDVRIAQSDDRENLKVGRSFESHRKREPARSPGARPDTDADAMIWIKGPMPAYVPLAVFTDFDGAAWQVVEPGKPSAAARKLGDSNWMEILHRPISPALSGTLDYEIRLGQLGGDVLPMPPVVERFKMGRVNRPDFFATTRSGLIRLATRTAPAGAMLEVVCKNVAPSRLVNVEPALPKHSDPSVLSTDHVDDRVGTLARDWANGRERGWRQIEQVVTRLREHVTLDRNATLDPSAHPVHDLLFASRHGADHQIAGAAVLLLRSLGYPARLVSGLYADESGIDDRSGFAALGADDVHFWIEVRLADGTWVTVDPSPGYPMLNLPTPPGEWLAGVWNDTRQLVTANALTFVAGLVGAGALFVLRRQVIDGLATAACVLRGCEPHRVLRVIELRSRLLGRPRNHSVPVGQWLGALDADPTTLSFAHALNRWLYRGPADLRHDDARATARVALNTLTLRALRNNIQETAP